MSTRFVEAWSGIATSFGSAKSWTHPASSAVKTTGRVTKKATSSILGRGNTHTRTCISRPALRLVCWLANTSARGSLWRSETLFGRKLVAYAVSMNRIDCLLWQIVPNAWGYGDLRHS